MNKKSVIIGGGVIGGGWAARFLLSGWDVTVYDPDPEASRKINAVLDNARRSLPALYDRPMPAEGRLSFESDLAVALSGAHWVQESVPERLDIKHAVYKDILNHLPKDAVLASSTSGFKPSELQDGMDNPSQIIVCHPFNPVYLLPVVEVVPSPATSSEIVEKTMATLSEIGMKPLHIRKEIDAHIADRLLEAVWREGLWLVNDGIATTEEIDDAIRFGFGLRWGQMGLFETYRIAGGEAGMAHFIAQFGPCLQWPWTKLMDVPELTDELVETIASQSDAQSGQHSIRELERIRDDNLVGMMRALKANNWGAGALLNAHEATLPLTTGDDEKVTLKGHVLPSWLDYNGHMTEYRYGQIIADASDVLILRAGIDTKDFSTGGSYFTVQSHVNYLDEMKLGEAFEVTTRVLSFAPKKLHVYHIVKGEGGKIAATGEQFLLHVDNQTRRPSDAAPEVLAALQDMQSRFAGEAVPEDSGRVLKQG